MQIKNIVLYLILVFLIAELTLRIQERLGPIYDLEMSRINLDCISDVLNHVNPPEYTLSADGKLTTVFYDKNGIRMDKSTPGTKNNPEAFKILFMGDSFMLGYDDEHTIPHYIYEYFKTTLLKNREIAYLNAACGSYSPAIYIPQAKNLIPLLKPDFVVIDIDETDLGDDFIRYKDLIARDNEGRIIAVRHSSIYRLFLEGFIKTRNQPLYLMRLISKIYHTRIYMPLAIKRYRATDPRHVLLFSWDTDKNAEIKYDKEISFFKKNVTELIETLIILTGNKRKILILYHPHLGHLKTGPSRWNNFVSDTIKEVTNHYDVAFYNATEDFKKACKGKPEKYYLNGDMHFSYEGLKIYSLFVAEQLLPMIERLIDTK